MLLGFAMMFSVFFAQPQPLNSTVATPAPVFAALPSQCDNTFFGLPPWYQYLDVTIEDGRCSVNFSLTDADGKFNGGNLLLLTLGLTDIALRLGALVAVAFVVVGGFKILTSQGEPEGVKAGRNTVFNAFIGVIITIIASTAVTYIGRMLSS